MATFRHVKPTTASATRSTPAPGDWTPAGQDVARSVGKDHGRLELRRYSMISDPALLAYLDPTGAWAGLRSLVQVEAERRTGGTRATDTRYCLSSLPSDAAAL